MTSRERLMATLRGEKVDRPAVNFYEIGGWKANPEDPDPYNIYNHPSWRPLLQLAEEKTDIIRMMGPNLCLESDTPAEEYTKYETYEEGNSRFTRTIITTPTRSLTSLTRRDAEIHTIWSIEHLLKDIDDVKAYLELPESKLAKEPDVSEILAAEEELGDRGIVMIENPDPICYAAGLFAMQDFLIIALTEQKLFHALLQRFAKSIYEITEQVCKLLPGRLWRIAGPEYASEPYLPPSLFREYVTEYTGPIVRTIKKYGGYARIH